MYTPNCKQPKIDKFTDRHFTKMREKSPWTNRLQMECNYCSPIDKKNESGYSLPGKNMHTCTPMRMGVSLPRRSWIL